MSGIILDIELADKNLFRELRVSIDGKVQGYSICPSKKYKPTKEAFWCTRNLHEIVRNKRGLDYSELSNIHHRAVYGKYFAKGTEKWKLPGTVSTEEVEDLEDDGCLKVQNFVDEEVWICLSYPVRHKTTIHCAERKAKLLHN